MLFSGNDPTSPVFASINAVNYENNGYSADWATDTKGFAIFTHNVINITDSLNITIGLRYIEEEKDGKGILNDVAPLPASASDNDVFLAAAAANEEPCLNAIFRGAVRSFCDNASWARKRNDDAVTGTFSVGYAFNDDHNMYVGYSRGFVLHGLQKLSAEYVYRS